MKILVFGGSGQLGLEVRRRAIDLNFDVVSPVQSELDITETEQVNFLAERFRPDLILNCAAYTAVDKAEQERSLAFQINCDGAANAARAAKRVESRMIYVSTDYVFDGSAETPIKEGAPTAPVNVYGESKLAGEKAVQEILGRDAIIVRTSSLHGSRGINFVHTMLRLFAEQKEVRVVNDQLMSPTWAGWLAEVLLDLGRTDFRSEIHDGLLHASSAGEITWFDFSHEIWRLSQSSIPGASEVRVIACTSEELPRPARRPRYSVMDGGLLERVLGRPAITWKAGLEEHLKELKILRSE